MYVPQRSSQHFLQWVGHGSNIDVHWQMNGYRTVVYICNGVLFSYKEHIWVGLNEVDEARAYCTGWSKSERERQILYFKVSVWNLERWHWWTYLHGSSRDADTENRLMEIVGE